MYLYADACIPRDVYSSASEFSIHSLHLCLLETASPRHGEQDWTNQQHVGCCDDPFPFSQSYLSCFPVPLIFQLYVTWDVTVWCQELSPTSCSFIVLQKSGASEKDSNCGWISALKCFPLPGKLLCPPVLLSFMPTVKSLPEHVYSFRWISSAARIYCGLKSGRSELREEKQFESNTCS